MRLWLEILCYVQDDTNPCTGGKNPYAAGMFESLSDNIGKALTKLRGKGYLTEEDVNAAMREVRIALLEADVSLPIVKDFINNVKEKAVGGEVVKSVSPAQMVIKIVQDELEAMLGSEASELNLRANPPVVIMMVGLQGSGKTTSCGKIAHQLQHKQNKKCLMASLDIYRPAAQQQLETLGKQAQVDTLPIIEGQKTRDITKRALKEAREGGYDVLFLDTAGRLHIDDELMQELQDVQQLSSPTEILLVVDSLTGQDAVNIAEQFNEKIGVSGIVLTRIDGDARGGAALSMRAATGCPIKFLGTGEKLSELTAFYPDRIAQRILGMGDVASLVEKAAEVADEEEAKHLAKKMKKGNFNYNDLLKQLESINKMGGMGSIMGLMPGMNKIKGKLDEAGLDNSVLTRQKAIIQSMTRKERQFPKLMNPSRKKRIAAGAGVTVQDVNMLAKQMKQMQLMMKKMGKMGKRGMMQQMAQLEKQLPPDLR